MSTYKQIAGTTVKAYTTNPSDPQEGEMWYNQTTLKLRGVTAVGAWASAASVIKNTYRVGSAGIQTSALLFGGSTSSPFTFFADTQEYNGSGFSSGGAMSQARWGLRGAGTQTAGLGFAGYIGPPGPPSKNSALTEEYDGSSWTSGGAMGTGRYALGGAGTQTSALAFGGKIYPGSDQTATEEYDGSSWTAGGALPSARTRLSGCGPSNSDALAVGHQTSGVCSTYDGTSWTDTGSLGTARYRGGSSGSTSSAITYGGSTHPGVTSKNLTESFDGSTWSTNPATMGTARYGFGYAGTKDSALAMSGYDTALTGVTEEYNFSAQVVTAAAWSSGGNLGTARYSGAGAGSKNAGLMIGGMEYSAPAGITNTEEYDGSSWSAGGAINRASGARTTFGSSGTQTASAIFGGGPASGGSSATEEYDGSSWTNVPGTLNTARYWLGSNGTQTSALAYGGTSTSPAATSPSNATEEYDGTTWSNGGNLSQTRYLIRGCGSQTAAVGSGGQIVTPPSITDQTEEYNGSSWSSGGSLIKGRRAGGATGTQTSALMFAGQNPSSTRLTSAELYNGTSFSTSPSLATARYGLSSSEDSSVGNTFAAGGNLPSSASNATEEFTPESTSVNSVDITTAE